MEIDQFFNPSAETFRQDWPLFSTLEAQWRAAGRAVPGTADPEWERLVQPPRFGQLSTARRQRGRAAGSGLRRVVVIGAVS